MYGRSRYGRVRYGRQESAAQVLSGSFNEALGLAASTTKSWSTQRNESLAVTGAAGKAPILSIEEALAIAETVSFLSQFTRIYLEALGLSDGDIERIARVFGEDLSLQGSLIRAMTKLLQGETLTLADELSKHELFSLAESLALDDQIALLCAYQRTLTEGMAIADSMAKQFDLFRELSESLPVASAVVKALSLPKSENVGLSDVVRRQFALVRSLSEALALAEEPTVALGRILSAVISLSDARNITIGKALSDALSLAGVAGPLLIALSKSESLALADGVSRALDFLRAETIGLQADRALVLVRSLAETLPVAGAVARAIEKPLSETVSIADALHRQTAFIRVLAQTLALDDGSLSAASISFREALALGDVRGSAVAIHALAEGIALSDVLALEPSKGFDESLLLAEALLRSIDIIRGETLALSDAKNVILVRVLRETFPLVDVILKAIERAPHSETLALAGSAGLEEAFLCSLAETLGLSDEILRPLEKVFAEAVSLQADRAAALTRDLADVLSVSGSASKLIRKTGEENLALAGAIIRAFELVKLQQLGLVDAPIETNRVFIRLFGEILRMADRLRLGGVWDDPNVRIITAILGASMKVERLKTGLTAETLNTELQTEVR